MSPRVRGPAAVVLAWSVALTQAAGCNALLGNQDATDVPADGGDAVDSSIPDDARTSVDGEAEAAESGAPSDALPLDGPRCLPDASFSGDPFNCGTCGHDCLGGACVAGACQPTTLFSGIKLVVDGLAVDDTNVFWGADGLFYGPKVPPGVARSIGSATFHVGAVAVDATFVYWLDEASPDGDLYACAKPPAVCAAPSRLTPVPHPSGVVLDSTNVYWSEIGTPGGVFSCSKAGPCDGGQPVSLLPNVPALAIGEAEVLWTSAGVLYGYGDGGTATLYAGDAGALRLGADDSSVYWTDLAARSVWSCAIGACDGGQVAAPAGGGLILEIVSDGTYAFWGDDSGSVYRYAPSTGFEKIAAIGPSGAVISALAVDSAAIYIGVSIPGGASIMKLAKP